MHTKVLSKFSDAFDQQVVGWKRESLETTSKTPTYILVGDNVDKNMKPRFMRIDHQVKSLHAWHQYATLHRFDVEAVAKTLILKDIHTMGANEFLPSVADAVALRSNYIILFARVLVQKLRFLQKYSNVVPEHITHSLSNDMAKKSEAVPLGVIPKNENKNEELIDLLEEVQQYVPSDSHDPQLCILAGDQLTAERIRGVQMIRAGSNNSQDRLECFFPTHADWHTQVLYLQVCCSSIAV